jgi:cysteine synthase A
MKYAKSVIDLVGHTPLVKINKLVPDHAFVLAKLENFNPMSSVKDRIALAMIENAEKKKLIGKDSVIIEPTSGNTGIGLAFVCAVKGYKLILTMPDTMSIERRKLLGRLGADIVLTPGVEGMKGAIEKAIAMAKKDKKAFVPQQFMNPANPEVHKLTTAEEIWKDTNGKVDIFIAGIGTGGTITGVGEILKKRNKNITIIGVEPEDSAVLSGEPAGPHKIQGIGAGFIPDVLKTGLIDEVIQVSNDNAFKMSSELAKQEGLFVGISSGAAMWATQKVAERDESKKKTIVTVFPDTGERYLSIDLDI